MNRDKFEEWADNEGYSIDRMMGDLGVYKNLDSRELYEAWQSAIASLDGYVVKNSTGSYTVHLKKEKEE